MDEQRELQEGESKREDLVRSILKTLEDITKQTRKNKNFKNEIAEELKNIGYNYFSETKEIEPEHVIKTLKLAINNTMSTKLDFEEKEADDDNESDKIDERKKIEKLLEINDGKSLDDYFNKGWEEALTTARSPLDLAKHVKKSAPLWLVKNLIKHQFGFKWATETGLPYTFCYYEFCEVQGTLKHLKYKPKKAQVKVELYQESLKRSPSELQLSEEQLCPLVYVKTTDGWKKWQAEGGKVEVVKSNEEFKWINEPIRNYILGNADEMRGDNEGEQVRKEETNVEKALGKPALYWVVVNDDFQIGGNSQLKDIGHTQVCMSLYILYTINNSKEYINQSQNSLFSSYNT